MNIIPFHAGDMAGKRELAVEDARVQQAMNTGVRRKLYQLQEAVGRELEPVECPLQHVFAPDACARTMRIPAGTVIVGKIHKHAHLNILSQGTVCVMTEGEGDQQLTGPLTMCSPPGTKRAVYAVTDAVWTTVHVLPLGMMPDLAQIEDYVIAKTFEEYEQFRLQGETMKQIEVQS
jgi:hypothetical protein